MALKRPHGRKLATTDPAVDLVLPFSAELRARKRQCVDLVLSFSIQ